MNPTTAPTLREVARALLAIARRQTTPEPIPFIMVRQELGVVIDPTLSGVDQANQILDVIERCQDVQRRCWHSLDCIERIAEEPPLND